MHTKYQKFAKIASAMSVNVTRALVFYGDRKDNICANDFYKKIIILGRQRYFVPFATDCAYQVAMIVALIFLSGKFYNIFF